MINTHLISFYNLVLISGNLLLLFMYVLLTILWHHRRREALIHAITSSILAWVVASFLKEFFPFPRPFAADGLIPTIGVNPYSGSFPSGHASAAFAFGTSAFMHDGFVGLFMLLGSILVGASRVVGHAHFPVDILGGAAVGSLVSYLVFRFHLYRWYHKK